MANGITIRAFRGADGTAVVALWRACGLVKPQNDPKKDIARKLRVNPEWRDIPVIVVTAKQLTVEERQWLGQNTQQVIAKGQSAHVDLSQSVRAVLARVVPAPAG